MSNIEEKIEEVKEIVSVLLFHSSTKIYEDSRIRVRADFLNDKLYNSIIEVKYDGGFGNYKYVEAFRMVIGNTRIFKLGRWIEYLGLLISSEEREDWIRGNKWGIIKDSAIFPELAKE